jgi:hypothetical protein
VPYFDQGVYCYCCCTCLAYGTPIAVAANDYKAVEQFLVGDMVLVTGPDLSWKLAEVAFSAGTGFLSRASLFIKVTFEVNGNEDFILVTQSQVFLMPDGTVKRADRLAPGVDQLVLAAGGTTPLISLEIGRYGKGIHHIATSLGPTTDLDGHLINAAGIVIGDYALQMGLRDSQSETARGEDLDELPTLGTPEYAQRYTHLEATAFRAALPGSGAASSATAVAESAVTIVAEPDAAVAEDASEAAASREADFTPLGMNSRYIPPDALSFVTAEQAWDIEQRAPRQPPASNVAIDSVQYLFKMHQTFYPEVHFVFEFESEVPNAWGFVENDVPFVIVSAGLTRTDALGFEGFAFIIAHALSGIYGGPPVADSGYSCMGQADYAAIVGVMSSVWRGPLFPKMLLPALAQVQQLFSYIAPSHRGGLPGNTCMHISIECRLQTMQAAMMSMPLPACAGGPTIDYLQLNSASAEAIAGGAIITLTFNEAVNTLTAQYPENFVLTPAVTVDKATVDEDDPSKVKLSAQITPGVEYKIDVAYVQSKNGDPIDPNKHSATFKLA